MTTVTAPTSVGTSYDEVPYTSFPYAQTHPDRLASIATLLGLQPTPVTRCRVLELGCASGGNLIPMAVDLPESRFVGIDLSARQIEDGRRLASLLTLSNIELLALDIQTVGPELGSFDYIICHGVYSWVPKAVREGLLAVCASRLAPNGIAYISYNTYPGWHMRGMIRDMMNYHAQRFTDPRKKVAQARALLDFLVEATSGQPGPYALLLEQELKTLRDKPDDYLLHEHLEEYNEPLYFHQFIEEAGRHGLAYLGDATLGTMSAHTFPARVREALNRVAADQIQREQYMDFLRHRTFRQTLLCHNTQKVSHVVEGTRLAGLHIGSRATAAAPPDLTRDQADTFTGTDNNTVTTRDPLLKAALLELNSFWPGSLPFEELYERAALRVLTAGGKHQGDPSRLGAGLVNCYLANLVYLWPRRPRYAARPSTRPVACPLVRLQAVAGHQVTNRRHEVIKLDDVERQLLPRLDGTRDQAALVKEITQLCLTGVLKARHEGTPVMEPARVEQTVANALPGVLSKLARLALLVS